MNKILPIILVIVFSGCAIEPHSRINLDPITNDRFESIRASCAEQFFCTGFSIVNKKEAYLYIGYIGDDWMFIESVEMKNNRTGDVLKLTGKFETQVLGPYETSISGKIFNVGGEVQVTEVARIKINKRIYGFIKSSLGDNVTLLINGSRQRIYTDSNISADPKADGHKKLWWAYFISRFKM